MILFMNADDIATRGLEAGAKVALETIGTDGIARRVEGLTIIDYPMSRGSVAGYYPELNPLLPLAFYDKTSGFTAAKSIPVRVAPMRSERTPASRSRSANLLTFGGTKSHSNP